MNDAGLLMSNLLTALNQEIGPIPPGPERDAKLEQVVRRYLAEAKTPKERLFWESMLRRKPTE